MPGEGVRNRLVRLLASPIDLDSRCRKIVCWLAVVSAVRRRCSGARHAGDGVAVGAAVGPRLEALTRNANGLRTGRADVDALLLLLGLGPDSCQSSAAWLDVDGENQFDDSHSGCSFQISVSGSAICRISVLTPNKGRRGV